jgi:acetyl esterase/lipase
MLDALAVNVKRGHGRTMKIVVILIGILALCGCALGVASGWSLLGLLNLADRAASGGEAGPVERDVAYGSDPRHRLNIWKPASNGANAPVLVFFYGGSWNSGERGLYDFAGRAFASQGFVTVIPDYRLVPEVRFPAFVEDAAAAVAWTRKNIARHGGDPDRIAVAGHSAGAHIAAMVAFDRQWLAKADAPDGTIRALVGLSGPYDFLPFTSDASKAAFGHEPDPRVTQPIAFARADAPPVLLLTGSTDTTVKPRNSRALAQRLGTLGVPHALKVYDGLNHTDPVKVLARPFRGDAPVLADIADFLRRQAPPRP